MFLDKILKKEEAEKPEEKTEELPVVTEEEHSSVLEEFLEVVENAKGRSIDETLSLVLAKARRITAAEAGSIFIARPIADDASTLMACSTQNDKIAVEHESFSIPIDNSSIAGYVANECDIVSIDDLYSLDESSPYVFNRSFDDKNNYRSVSMLAFPLKNFNNEVIGVVQLINHIDGVDEEGNTKYTPFPLATIEKIKGIITILGVMVERIDLIGEIKRLQG